jgi:hypothetical protein
MGKDKPDFQDAELTLRVYEMRREAVMRESRNAIMAKFWPKNYEDLIAVTKPDNPLNAPYRQVASYWEMVYGFAKHGITNADFFIENNGEGLFLYAKVLPYVERFRKEFSPVAFQNAEWIATQCSEGRRRFEMIQGRVKKMMETK